VDVADIKSALTRSCDLVAEALRADKVDAFLYEPSKDTLVALSTNADRLAAKRSELIGIFCGETSACRKGVEGIRMP
jgi:hypothetical protein